MKNFKGKTMLPGFIDAQGYIWNAGLLVLSANLLPAADGAGNGVSISVLLINNCMPNGRKKILTRSSYALYKIVLR